MTLPARSPAGRCMSRALNAQLSPSPLNTFWATMGLRVQRGQGKGTQIPRTSPVFDGPVFLPLKILS
jgi:hypothetical protein